MLKDTIVNRIYIKKSDFPSLMEYREYISQMLSQLSKVETNALVGYLSLDRNVYVIEVNPLDAAINATVPFWITPDELALIQKYRKGLEKSSDKLDINSLLGLDSANPPEDDDNGSNGGHDA